MSELSFTSAWVGGLGNRSSDTRGQIRLTSSSPCFFTSLALKAPLALFLELNRQYENPTAAQVWVRGFEEYS